MRQTAAPGTLPEILEQKDGFIQRHVGPTEKEVASMLKALNCSSLEELIEQTIPEHIRCEIKDLGAPAVRSETEVLDILELILKHNNKSKNFIGKGYYGTITPYVIQRSLLENPLWYTSYTPYQAEISQGRLESLVNFQTLVTEITGMEIANASLLDEGTAAAEALGMLLRLSGRKAKNLFFISNSVHKQTTEVVRTRAKYMGVQVVVGDTDSFDFSKGNLLGALVQYPDTFGSLRDYSSVSKELHDNNAYLVVAADPLNLMVSKPPSEFGADVVVGSMQRFGVPMYSGGPAAAYFATSLKNLRKTPGRIIGISKDDADQPA